MSILDRRLERSVRTQARARGIVTWTLTHPAGWLGWLHSAVAFVLLTSFGGFTLTFFVFVAVFCSVPDYFQNPSAPLPPVAQLPELHRLAVLAISFLFGTLIDLLRLQSFCSTPPDIWLRICPVSDATVRRFDDFRRLWWLVFTITLFVLMALEWLHGVRTPDRWIAVPVIAALMATITHGSARVMRILIPRSSAHAAAIVACGSLLIALTPAMTATGEFSDYWASPWYALLPTAWPLYAWRSGLAIDNFWLWGTVVAAAVVWWYGQWLLDHAPIHAQEVEDQLYERPLAKPLFSRRTPPAESTNPSVRVQAEFSATRRDQAGRSLYRRWLDWPATHRDLAIAEFSGWIHARPKPEWVLATVVLAAMLAGRLLVWQAGIYAGLFDVVFLAGAIAGTLIVELNPHRRAMAQPISFDDALKSVMRVAIARVKRFVPYLVLYAAMLMNVERQSWWIAAAICFGPPAVLLTFVPLIVAGPVLFRSIVATPQRWGILLGGPMIILGSLTPVLPFVAVNFVLDKYDPPKGIGGAAIYLTGLVYGLVAVVLARYLFRRGTFDIL